MLTTALLTLLALAPSTAVDDPPPLKLWLGVPRDERGASEVEFFSDLRVQLDLRCTLEGGVLAAVPGAGASTGPIGFFELEVRSPEGIPIPALPCQLETRLGAADAARALRAAWSVQEMSSGSRVRFDWALAEFGAWGATPLFPGEFQMRVLYHGPPPELVLGGDRQGEVWRGEVASEWRDFSIEPSSTPWFAGPPVEGLSASMTTTEHPPRFLDGEAVGVRLRLENVGSEPLSFARVLPAYEQDFFVATGAGTHGSSRGGGFKSGWRPMLRWTLAPGEAVVIPPQEVHLAVAQEFRVDGFPRRLSGPPAEVEVRWSAVVIVSTGPRSSTMQSLQSGPMTWSLERR